MNLVGTELFCAPVRKE